MTRFDGLKILQIHLAKPQFTVLIGARQLGKTTLVKQLLSYLEDRKEIVYYLTFEDPTVLSAINEHPQNLFNFTLLPADIPLGSKMYVVIDEVQYANNPTNFLKFLYDEYADKLKLIVTGSSAFYIDKNFKDSLAGRKQVFELYPLAFDEFLHFKGEDTLIKEWQQLQQRSNYMGTKMQRLQALFSEYVTYGGYPAVVLANTEQEKQDMLNDLVNSYMKKDALEAGIREQTKFFQLARILAEQVGGMVNQNELSNTLQLASGTVENYLYLLQKTFIVQLITPKFGNLRKELTKMPKIFFNDTGLRNALTNSFIAIANRTDKGNLLENVVYTRLRKLYGVDALRYWRTADGNEVDFIVEQNLQTGKAYEVKYNDAFYKPSKYKKFIEGYPNFPLQLISVEAKDAETIPILRL